MKKWLGVGKFTTHPPWRNNDIFLEKVDFKEISQQLNFKDISALFAWSLPFFNSHQVLVSESLIRLEGGLLRRVKYNPNTLNGQKIEYGPKNEVDPKNKDDPEKKDGPKMKITPKMKMASWIKKTPKKITTLKIKL